MNKSKPEQQVVDTMEKIEVSDLYKESLSIYADEVNSGRMIPNIYDGLTPVQRRVLFTLKNMGVFSNSQTRKCAKIVGEVMGNYHPHGDSGIYSALITMAQDWTRRAPLTYIQGNGGSIVEPGAASSRYTECKLTKYSEDVFLKDLSKETVLFVPNYDDTTDEPSVLPAILPHILIQGNGGIGWGVKADWLPHNPLEVARVLIAYVKDRTLTVPKILKIMPGPDFPTGGIINGMGNIGATSIYYNGHGGIKLRGKYHIEDNKKGKSIVITEIPWGVSLQKLLEKFVELHSTGEINLKNIQDETGKDGIRIVLTPKDDNDIDRIMNVLYKKTQFESNVPSICYAVEATGSKGLPKKYNILNILRKFISFREVCIHKKLKAELERKSDRLHILKGLFIVNKEIEKCIDIIRKSNGGDDTIKKLCNYFKIDERQAKYVVDMKLGRLSGLDMNLTKQEETKLKEEVKVLTRQTRSVSNNDIDEYMINEWENLIKTTLKDFKRKTEIRYETETINIDETIKDLPCSVIITSKGYIKRTARLDKMQNRASMGILLGLSPDEDIVQMIHTTTTTPMYAITNQGRAHIFRPYTLDEVSKTSRGKYIPNLFKLRASEKIIKFINHDPSQDVLALLSEDGQLKLTSISELAQLRANGKRICSEDLKIVDICLAKFESDTILVVTKNGMGTRFKLNELRISGVGAGGVRAIKLKENDQAVSFTPITDEKEEIIIISSNAFIKRCENNEFPVKSRGGYGVIIAPHTDDYGYIVSAKCKADDVTIITQNGRVLTIDLKQVRKTSRGSKGVKAINLQGNDSIHSII